MFHKTCCRHGEINITSYRTMGKRGWTTPDQRQWLEARIPEFVQVQKDKTTSSIFFLNVHQAWQQQWPTQSPTAAELQDAKGDEKVALALKTKATEGVSVSIIIDDNHLTHNINHSASFLLVS